MIGYARVSTNSQKEDLLNQQKVLNNIVKANNYNDFMFILGFRLELNYKKGLNKLIELITSKKISKIIITHHDRMIRFRFELIQRLCTIFNVEIFILHKEENISEDKQFCTDLYEIVTVFSSRLYGKRSHKNKKLLK